MASPTTPWTHARFATAMAAAFAQAGYVGPQEKLRRLMGEAIIKGKGLIEPSTDAFIKALLAEKDGYLVWELFIDERARRVQKLFGEVLVMARQAQQSKESGRGPARIDTQARNAVPGSAPSRGGHTQGDTQGASATPATAPSSRPRRSTEAMDAVAQVSKTAYLKTFKINGRPIGELTAGEARAWCKAQGVGLRFVALLTYDLHDDTVIGVARSEEEAAEAYHLASSVTNA